VAVGVSVVVVVVGMFVGMMIVGMIVPVILSMVVSMSMSMIVAPMRMAVGVPMIVPVVGVPESHQSNHVHHKPQRTDHKQLLHSANLFSFQDSLQRFPHKLHTDQHEKDAISKARQRVKLAPAIRLFRASGPFGSDCGAESDDES
jgi:hypothetical protein